MREELKNYFSIKEWKGFTLNISKLLDLSVRNFCLNID